MKEQRQETDEAYAARMAKKCDQAQWLIGVLAASAIVAYLLAGCATSLMSRAPVTRSAALAMPPAAAFQRATGTFTRMGGQVQMYDAPNRRLSGLVHGAVVLTVTVDAQSIVEVTGTLVPGKIVVGAVTETDDYLALLTQETR